MQLRPVPGYWTALVHRIQRGDISGVEDLYYELEKLVRAKFVDRSSRTRDCCFEDSLHEVLLIVLETIRGGDLRDPERLPAFICTVARRQMVASLRRVIVFRRLKSTCDPGSGDSPEARLSGIEKSERVRAALDELNRRDREILERFYFKEQPAHQICGEMQLTGTQFRLYKSRAIAKCSHFLTPAARAGGRFSARG